MVSTESQPIPVNEMAAITNIFSSGSIYFAFEFLANSENLTE
jgi:hypothetical protein